MSICSTAAPDPKTHAPAQRILDAKWDGKSVFTVTDVAEIFEISPWAVYQAIKDGELGAVKIGRLLKIPRHTIERKLAV
jgi:excisionase family DNA binding protein